MKGKAIGQRTGDIGEELAAAARWLSSVHRPNGLSNACVAAPRSQSTWLLELVLMQPCFKPCNEPDARVARPSAPVSKSSAETVEFLQERNTTKTGNG